MELNCQLERKFLHYLQLHSKLKNKLKDINLPKRKKKKIEGYKLFLITESPFCLGDNIV